MRPASPSPATRPLLIAALLVGLALRLYRLGAESLWYDEAVSVYLSTQRVPALIAHTAGDIHPPGYYLLLHLWGLIARPTLLHGLEFLYAWVSVAAGLLLLALLVPVGRRLVGEQAALVSLWLAALHPFHLWYSQEVRMYTLGGALGLLCLYATLRWLEEGRARWLCLYAAGAAGGLYTLYYFVFVIAGIGLAVLLLSPTARRRLGWLAAHALVLTLYLPWLGIFVRQATDPPVPAWRAAWQGAGEVIAAAQEAAAAALVGQTPVGPIRLWAVAALVVAGAAVALAPSRRRAGALLLLTAGPVALLFLVSATVTPLYHVRYLFPLLAAFPLLAGSLVVSLWDRGRAAGALAAVAFVALSLAALRAYWTDPAYRADDHRAAVAKLAAVWRPGDVILVNAGWVYPLLEVYWPRVAEGGGSVPAALGPRVRLIDVAESDLAAGDASAPIVRSGSVEGEASLGWGRAESDFFAITRAESEAGLEALAARFARLWHYRLYDTVSDPQGALRAWLDAETALLRAEPIPGRDFGLVELRDFGAESQADADFAPAQFGEALRLVGVEVPTEVAAGSTVYVTLVWEPLPGLRDLPVGLSSSLRLYDAAGAQVAQADGAPDIPTTGWEIGRLMQTPLAVGVPAAAAAGPYTLELIVYRQDDAIPLPLDDARAVDTQRLRLETVTITP